MRITAVTGGKEIYRGKSYEMGKEIDGADEEKRRVYKRLGWSISEEIRLGLRPFFIIPYR